MENHFLRKRVAVKGFPIFSQIYNRWSEDTDRQMSRMTNPSSNSSSKVSQKSFNKRFNQNVFKCRFNGCRNFFSSQKSLNTHRSFHLVNESPEDSVQNDDQLPKPMVRTTDSSDTKLSTEDQMAMTSTEPLMPSISGNGFSSSRKVRMHFKSDHYFGQMRCICNICGHKTFGFKASARMAVHINGKHLRNIVYRCDVHNCNKVFYAPNSLRYHKTNHFCGFGIKNGKTLNTVCGNESINRFREQIVIKDIKFYKCIYSNDCKFITTGGAIKRHIHDKHLCPNRIKSNLLKDSSINSFDVMNSFEDFCQILEVDTQKLYKCKSCQFFTEKIKGFVAHIKLKHFTFNHMNDNSSSSSTVPTQHSSESIDCQNDSNTEDNCMEKLNDRRLKHTKVGRPRKCEIPWLPFNCTHCRKSFDDLLLMRNHLKTDHK